VLQHADDYFFFILFAEMCEGHVIARQHQIKLLPGGRRGSERRPERGQQSAGGRRGTSDDI